MNILNVPQPPPAITGPDDFDVHFSPGPFINIRTARCNEMICRVGGMACLPPDVWSSQLT